MKENQDKPADAAELRRRAEERLRRPRSQGDGPSTEVETARLVHELQVHQIELEMQNEELQRVRAQAEELLAEYTDLYDFAPAGYMTLDREGVVRRVNLTGARLLGVDRSRLVSRHFSPFLAESDRRTFNDFLHRVFASETRQFCEVALSQEHSQPLVLQLDGTHTADGQECRAVMLDVTERKRAEAALSLQSAALDAAANAIIITDRTGAIRWINTAFTTLTGYSAAEAIGRNPRELVRSGLHDQAFYKQLWDTLLAGKVWRGTMTNRRKNGSLYPEEQTITPVRDAHGEIVHFVAIKQDLTEQKQMEAQFLQSQKMETVGRLAGGIAHDFNNLLTVINGTADLVMTDLKEGDPLRTQLQDIRQAGERAALLTRQLLAFSRRQIMRLQFLNLNTLIEHMERMLRRLIGEDITLVVVLAKDAPCVMADPVQIEQVVMNIAVNARDAMPNGGKLTIEIRNVELDEAYAAEHPSVQPGPHVMLAISDTGVGMDEATVARIFEPFFTTKGPGKGTGLGLSMVYGVVKQSNGSIWASSEPGKGTTFRIYLPRVDAVVQKAQPVRAVESARGTETILIVEDEQAVCRLAKRVLESAGYTVLTASNGARALQLLEQHDRPVHLMLTDVVMPGMSGRDLGTRLKDIHPQMKVLYTSGYPDDVVLREGPLEKTDPFIGKPYTAAGLTRRVREVLDS